MNIQLIQISRLQIKDNGIHPTSQFFAAIRIFTPNINTIKGSITYIDVPTSNTDPRKPRYNTILRTRNETIQRIIHHARIKTKRIRIKGRCKRHGHIVPYVRNLIEQALNTGRTTAYFQITILQDICRIQRSNGFGKINRLQYTKAYAGIGPFPRNKRNFNAIRTNRKR